MFYTPLLFAENRIKLLEESRTKKLNQKKEIRIQVAHNSLQLNNHINILSQLEKYRENNIRVILPLSYGTYGINGQFGGFAYRKSVIQCAYSFIGKNKVSILSKELPLEKYLQYLWNIDIAVFNVNRPIGLANIIYMLYMGKKVFLPANSPHYKFFKEIGLPVFKTEDIDFMTYDEFIRPVDTQVSNWIIKRLSPGEGIKNWDNLFLQISGETYVKNNHL